MTRRLANITLDNLDDLPGRCRQCVFWELDPVAGERAAEAGDTGLEKEAWVSAALLEWGSCGKVLYVDGVAAGFVLFAPPSYVPRSVAFPTSPVSADAVLLMTAHVVPGVRRRRARPDAGPGRREGPDPPRGEGDRGVRGRAVDGARALRGAGRLPAGGRVQDGPAAPAASRGCGWS